jgi:hypothetical protein
LNLGLSQYIGASSDLPLSRQATFSDREGKLEVGVNIKKHIDKTIDDISKNR